MDAIELLTRDHQAVKALFAELEAERSGDGGRSDLLGRIRRALDLHAALEEELFYPAVEETAEDEASRELVRGARQDHAVIRALLADLSAIDPRDERFSGKARVLQENVERHVAEEESLVLPAFRQRVSSEELELLGEQMEARKAELEPRAPAAAPAIAAPEERRAALVEQRTRLAPAGRRSRTGEAGQRAPRQRRSVGGRRKSSKRRAAATRGRP
jgi:hemerythrin superfamily protein